LAAAPAAPASPAATTAAAAQTPAAVNTAVIVAAGIGSRLRDDDDVPKPLRPLITVPLIARVMAAAARAGIGRFVVVVGYQAERMKQALPAWVPPGCMLQIVENKEFRRPNGVSLQAALDVVAEPFCLLMSDHVFTDDRLRAAREAFESSRRSLLVVEDASCFEGDLDDATRVATGGGRVVAIGKELATFDAIDTGMFILDNRELARAFVASGEAPSISDAMRVLAAAGELDAFDPRTGVWQDIDTPEDLVAAERVVYASLRKAADGFMARILNRRISLFFSKRLWRMGVTPNVATAFTLLLGLAAGAAFAQGGTVAWGLLGATLFQLQSILDGVDGELARLLHRESRFGFWFDVSADNLTHIAVFLGIARGQAASGLPGPWTVLGLVAATGVIASFLSAVPLLPGRPGRPSPRQHHAALDRVVSNLTKRDFTYLLFPAALFGWLGVFLWAAAAGTWLFAGTTVVARIASRSN